MKIIKQALIVSCIFIIAACGGGGGSDPQVANEPRTQLIEFYGDSTQWGWDSGNNIRAIHPSADFVNIPGYYNANLGVISTDTTDLINGSSTVLPWSTRIRQSTASVIVVNHGINDSNKISLDQYADNLRVIASEARAAGKRIFFETSNPATAAIAPNLSQYVQRMRDVAAEINVQVIDVNQYMTGFIGGNPITDYMPDGVHPNQATYQAIGEYMNVVLLGYMGF